MTVTEMMKARWASGVYDNAREAQRTGWKGKRYQETMRVRRLRAGLPPLDATPTNSVRSDVEPLDSAGGKP